MARTGEPEVDDARAGTDLRTTLLREGIELARAGGADAVSLRNVQRRAGVSHSAAYRHFADRAALLTAISDHAAEQMADRMRSAIAATDLRHSGAERARARFRATGAAYLDFALAEPGLFTVAFRGQGAVDGNGPAGPDRSAHPADSPPFQLLVKCLDDLVDTGTLEPGHRPYTDIAAWAAVHGLAVLILDGPLHQLPPEGRDAAIARLLTVIDQGTH